MSVKLQRVLFATSLLALAGCSTVNDVKQTVSGWVGGESSNGTLNSSTEKKSTESSGPSLKYGATLRVLKYVDERKVSDVHLLGVTNQRVGGMSGTQLMLDQEISSAVAGAVKKRFDTEGFQVLEGTDASRALFEVSGVIKDLTLNVKERDSISIGIETTLKEVASGKVIWSGLVTEKNDRFAGISGNDKADVVRYFNRELGVATAKTVDAISASLMASRPELFNLTAGTKAIKGVTVYVAPTASAAVPTQPTYGVTPAYGVPNGTAIPSSSYMPHASATTGLLLVNTEPQRAKVYLDGVYYGMSPLRLEMDPGVHAISVKLEGYKMVTEKVSVRKGDNTEIELNLER